eukprot:TRINITY_DN66742_c0_g1_i1.p1 TRINITY_DN66742_c0_g1~~TRINITY_DN66742_c0_g1_i1.p1  ORF type:complete len:519 (+),score=82.51 TRINITY_DN66742_c0_g1_i1:69-1559(+)
MSSAFGYGHLVLLAALVALQLVSAANVWRDDSSADASRTQAAGPTLVRRDLGPRSEPANAVSAADTTAHQRAAAAALSPAARPAALLSSSVGAAAPKLRPTAGGPATVIEYRILFKKFYGLDFKLGTWQGEFVVITSWKDTRTSSLAGGRTEVSFSKTDAEKMIWIPDIAITNREFDKVSTVSSTVRVHSNGNVLMTERLMASMKISFDASLFPFDRQRLIMRLSSTSLMIDELEFTESNAVKSDVMKSAFSATGGWRLNVPADFKFATTIKELVGPLRKSRVEFAMEVERDPSSFFASTMFPQYLMVAGAFSIFYYPMIGPFAMPRVAIVTIGFLSLSTLQSKTASMMPSASSTSWINIFEESCMLTVGFATIANLLIENSDHTYARKDLATTVNLIARGIYAGLFFVTFLFQTIAYYAPNGILAVIWVQRVVMLFASLWLCYYVVTKKNQPPPGEGGDAAADSAEKPAEASGGAAASGGDAPAAAAGENAPAPE